MNYRSLLAAAGALCLLNSAARAELTWHTDYDVAVKQAKDEGKLVFIDFTGSDWCGWCMKLKAEVFDKPEFAAFANANLVLLEVDFPKGKPQTDQQRANNAALATKYGISGYPTIFVVNTEGKPVARGGYVPGGPDAFIAALKKTPGVTWKDSEPVTSAPARSTAKTAPPNPDALWADIAATPKRYEDLKLTGLSGTSNRRLAIINNQTFAPGEVARVKLKDIEVKVLCKEIRARSVVVQLDNGADAKELFLGGGR
jgi:protein disulfide-isomerase